MNCRKKWRTALLRFLLGLIVLNFVGILTVFFWKISKNQKVNSRCNIESISKKLIGNPFPKYHYLDADGNEVSPSFDNDDLLVSFIHSSCDACKIQLTAMPNEVSRNAQKLKIIAIAAESPEIVRDYIKRNDLRFPVFINQDQTLVKDLGISCTPTNILIEEGIVKKIKVGKISSIDELLEN